MPKLSILGCTSIEPHKSNPPPPREGQILGFMGHVKAHSTGKCVCVRLRLCVKARGGEGDYFVVPMWEICFRSHKQESLRELTFERTKDHPDWERAIFKCLKPWLIESYVKGVNVCNGNKGRKKRGQASVSNPTEVNWAEKWEKTLLGIESQ